MKRKDRQDMGSREAVALRHAASARRLGGDSGTWLAKARRYFLVGLLISSGALSGAKLVLNHQGELLGWLNQHAAQLLSDKSSSVPVPSVHAS